MRPGAKARKVWRVEVRDPDGAVCSVLEKVVPVEEPLKVGRSDRKGNQLVLEDWNKKLSREQLLLTRVKKGIRVENLGRPAVVRLETGEEIAQDGYAVIKPGETIQVLDFVLTVDVRDHVSSYYLEIRHGDRLYDRVYMQGRSRTVAAKAQTSSQKILVDLPGVSREKHFTITDLGYNRFQLRDEGSRNGLWIRPDPKAEPERVDEVEIGFDEVFCFGEALGVMKRGEIPQARRHLPLIASGAAALLILGMIPFLSPDESDGPVDPDVHREALSGLILEAGDAETLRRRLHVYLEGAKDVEFPEKTAAVDFLEVLRDQKRLRTVLHERGRSLELAKKQVLDNPWSLTAYRPLDPLDREGFIELEARKQALLVWADSLELNVEDIRPYLGRVEPADWEARAQSILRHNRSVAACAELLRGWREREWVPVPTGPEKERWEREARGIRAELARTTMVAIMEYDREIGEIRRVWTSAEQWLEAFVSRERWSGPLPAPTWEFAYADLPAGDPRKHLEAFARAETYHRIRILSNRLENVSDVVAAAPVLAAIFNLMPEWTGASEVAADWKRLVRNHLRETAASVRRAENVVFELDDLSTPGARDRLLGELSGLPAVPWTAEVSRVLPEAKPVLDRVKLLRDAVLKNLLEPYYQRQFDEEVAGFLFEALDTPFMRGFESFRKENLMHQARKKLGREP